MIAKTFPWLRRLVVGTADRPSVILLALFAGASLIILGYHFAVWDQLLYLAFVDRYFQPIVDHPGDLYVSNFLWHSYTTFWMLIYPLKQLCGWEWPLFVIHVIVKLFIFWGVWSLAFAFTKDRLTAWLSVLLLLMNKAIIGGGINFYMADTITRYVAVPFLLFGVRNLWERKYVSAALLFGLAFQIHALSASYWLVALAISGAIYRLMYRPADAAPVVRPPGEWRRIAWATGLFVLLALPILIWFGIAESGTSRAAVTPEYANFIRSHHSYVFFNNYDASTWKTLFLFALLILVALRYLPDQPVSRWYAPFTVGIVAVLTLHYFVADVFFYHPLLKHQTLRIVDLFGLLAMIGAARILAVHAARGGCQRWLAALIAAFLLVGTVTPGPNVVLLTTAVFLLLLLALEPQPGRFTIPALVVLLLFLGAQVSDLPASGRGSLRTPVWSLLLVTLLAIAALLFTGWFATLTNRRRFLRAGTFGVCLTGLIGLVTFERVAVFEVANNWTKAPRSNREYWERMVKRTQENLNWPGRGMRDDWIEFQLWVRDHTPGGTLFFVPPGVNGFRVFSQRNAFFELYDCEPAIFSPAYTAALMERLKVFDYWPPTARNLNKAEPAYYGMKPARWQELAQEWDVAYLITARTVTLPFPKLHQHGVFTLWQIPAPPVELTPAQ